jgi:hypothetical protein
MKTLLITLVTLFASVQMFANIPLIPDDYVKTKNDVLYYTKLTVGATKARLILDNGKKITLMNNELIAYKKDGKIYEKVPLYVHNKSTDKMVFMEIIKYTNGMKLYRYHTYESENKSPYTLGTTKEVDKFYVYKNGNYHLQLDDANYKTVFAFFGITPVYQ